MWCSQECVLSSLGTHPTRHVLQGYVERKVAAAQEMIKNMYLPDLQAADIDFSVNVHVVEGARSAAGIAEQVVQAATQAGSDLLVVTSHGGYAPSIVRLHYTCHLCCKYCT